MSSFSLLFSFSRFFLFPFIERLSISKCLSCSSFLWYHRINQHIVVIDVTLVFTSNKNEFLNCRLFCSVNIALSGGSTMDRNVFFLKISISCFCFTISFDRLLFRVPNNNENNLNCFRHSIKNRFLCKLVIWSGCRQLITIFRNGN